MANIPEQNDNNDDSYSLPITIALATLIAGVVSRTFFG